MNDWLRIPYFPMSMPVEAFDHLPAELQGFVADRDVKKVFEREPFIIIPDQGDFYDLRNGQNDEDADIKLKRKRHVYLSFDENEYGKFKNTRYLVVRVDRMAMMYRTTHVFSYAEAVNAGAVEPFISGSKVRSKITGEYEIPFSIDLQKLDAFRV